MEQIRRGDASVIDHDSEEHRQQRPGPTQPQRPDDDKAIDDGRGRTAEKPSDIPSPGWKDILWRVYEGISEDRILANAAAVTFYALLALFPAIAARSRSTAYSPIPPLYSNISILCLACCRVGLLT